jgi:hypothetical protein
MLYKYAHGSRDLEMEVAKVEMRMTLGEKVKRHENISSTSDREICSLPRFTSPQICQGGPSPERLVVAN